MYTAITLTAGFEEPIKIAADDTFIFFYFNFSEKIRLDSSCIAEDSQEISCLIFCEKQ